MTNINNNFIENSIGFTTKRTIEETKKTITLFFHQLGYHSIIDNNQKINIKRGSETKNGFTNNPMKWKSEIVI